MEKQPPRKKITLDALAAMVQRGFEEVAKKADVDLQFKEVTTRLDHIEKILLAQQAKRIERLETKMQKVEDALAM